MPFWDDAPHPFSQLWIIWFYKEDWKIAFYSYFREVISVELFSFSLIKEYTGFLKAFSIVKKAKANYKSHFLKQKLGNV